MTLPDRLRKLASGSMAGFPQDTCLEAAQEIERLTQVLYWATLCNFCPSEGGYREGASIEGCYEGLDGAVQDYYGTDLPYPADEWWTEQELMEVLGKGGPGAQGFGER